jgi:2,4-dienoyl-CoA reductase (NADPH2)
MSNSRYKKLLEPGYIGSVRVKRRLIRMGASPGSFPYEDGNVPQAAIDFYEALAAGGAGLVTAATGMIDWPLGFSPGSAYRMDNERYIPSFKRLADAIHKHDCAAFIQMFHLGPMHPENISGVQPIAASALSKSELPKPDLFVPREMTLNEIHRVIREFVNGAVNMHKAGLDGIELNASCAHLLNSFLSRAWNKRHDEYGCDSLENRARIVVEIIQGIKLAAGKEFAIIALFNAVEAGLKDGITLEESKVLARMFEAAGADAVDVRAEFYTSPRDLSLRDSSHFPDVIPYPEEPLGVSPDIDLSQHGAGGWAPLAAAIKKVISIPVIAVGRMDPDMGERLLEEGKADFINHNRRLMADHDLPNKIAEGREDDIAPCTGCMVCFEAAAVHHSFPRCRINAALGREKEYEIKPAALKKRVMVVGCGPAGMEAARVAALRGHDVTLYDKMGKLGGSMLVAAMVKGLEKEDLLALIRYFEIQLGKLGVKVELGCEVSPAMVAQIKPDVLVVATGAQHNIPNIKGIGSSNVVTGEELHHRLKFFLKFAGPKLLHWLTQFYLPVGKNVIVLGARLHGCQTAEFLVKRGRNVTIVDTCSAEKIGDGLVLAFMKPLLLQWLDKKGVKIMPEVKYEEITREGLVVITKEGVRQTLKANTIVTALPMKPDTAMADRMKGTAKEVYAIGDCNDPNYIVDAIADGARIGRTI